MIRPFYGSSLLVKSASPDAHWLSFTGENGKWGSQTKTKQQVKGEMAVTQGFESPEDALRAGEEKCKAKQKHYKKRHKMCGLGRYRCVFYL
jgi:hypothetical protein